jgi:predicted phosphodiesterase
MVGKLLFVHGSPKDPTCGYVYPDSDLSVFDTDADFVFMGNSHYPFIRKHQGVTYINVGSCGLPRDDGRYGSIALFDTDTGVARIIRFDIRGSSAKTLAEVPDVHGTVTALFDRKKKKLFGEFYG